MKLHIISTVNGITNEGMRNVATHLSQCFEAEHPVRYSGLKSIASVVRNSLWADVTVVFARANPQLYLLLKGVQLLCKHVWVVSVQKPTEGFLRRNDRSPLRCGWLYLSESDIAPVRLRPGCTAHPFQAGLKTDKFTPADRETQAQLKKEWGFDPNKPLVVHVGHCSSGRGLEAFCALDKEKFQCLMVASGMFEDASTVAMLENRGVRLHRGYLEQVQQIYQMADLYLFPTRSNEFVISVPLSVMEALACGTPVIGFRGFDGLLPLAAQPEDMVLLNSMEELNDTALQLQKRKRQQCLLRAPQTWPQIAQEILKTLSKT